MDREENHNSEHKDYKKKLTKKYTGRLRLIVNTGLSTKIKCMQP
jgi:hypothetical protein